MQNLLLNKINFDYNIYLPQKGSFLVVELTKDAIQKYVENEILKQIKFGEKLNLTEFETICNFKMVFEVKTDGTLPLIVKAYKLGLPAEALFFTVVSNGSNLTPSLIITGCIQARLDLSDETPSAVVELLNSLEYSWKLGNKELQLYAVDSNGKKFFNLPKINPAVSRNIAGGKMSPVLNVTKLDALTPFLEVVAK